MDGISSQAVAVRDGCCDGGVTLNVEVVPGLYYAADSAATIEALKRPGAAELTESGFSSEGLIVTLERTVDGKAKAAVTPDGVPPAFFLRVRVK